MCPSGELLAFGCRRLGQLLVWGWQSETYVLKQQSHLYDMNVMSYSPDGQLIATGGDDGKVGWNAPCFEQITCCYFHFLHWSLVQYICYALSLDWDNPWIAWVELKFELCVGNPPRLSGMFTHALQMLYTCRFNVVHVYIN